MEMSKPNVCVVYLHTSSKNSNGNSLLSLLVLMHSSDISRNMLLIHTKVPTERFRLGKGGLDP